jgi:hypothetical protein
MNQVAATGVSEARSSQRRGNNTPTLMHLEGFEAWVQRSKSIRRSGFGRRETSGPPESCTEPKTPWGVSAAKAAIGTGNERGAGTRSSIGWQKLVGRIARLLHREVARPVGDRRGR